MNDNHGFTMTEIIVAMVVSTILMLGMFYLFTKSVQGFNILADDTLIQNEMDADSLIFERIFRCAKDVKKDDSSTLDKVIYTFDLIVYGRFSVNEYYSSTGTFYIRNCKLIFDKNKGTLYLDVPKTSDVQKLAVLNNSVMAKYVDDIDIVDNDSYVELNIKFKLRKKSYNMKRIIKKYNNTTDYFDYKSDFDNSYEEG